jgi:hypothetical protein
MSSAQAVKKITPRRLSAFALIAALALAPVAASGDQAFANDPACGPVVGGVHQVFTAAHLQAVGSGGANPECGLGASYLQREVIELAGVSFTPIASAGTFTGSYDGQNFAIRDLELEEATLRKVGLFSKIGGEATLQNIRLERAHVVVPFLAGSTHEAAALVGSVEGNSSTEIARIINSHASGSVTGGTVNSDGGVTGGLVGSITNGLIQDSSADVTVSCNGSEFSPCGGLVGSVGGNTEIKDSVARGDVASLGTHVGGFVGYHDNVTASTTRSTAEGNVSGVSRVGGFVGKLERGTITNSHALGGMVVGTGSRIGGFVGELDRGSIEGSSAKSAVEGNGQVGGFAGVQGGSSTADATINSSYASGTVTGATGSIGGLVGEALNGDIVINESYASGSVTGGGDEVGGLVGTHRGPIDNSYATGSVTNTGTGNTGGLVGYSYSGAVITNSYSTGLVTSENGGTLGGLVGGNGGGVVTNSFWDIETSGQQDSDGGDGKTTADMTSFATFSGPGWKIIQASSFGVPTGSTEQIWGIGSAVNCGYPFLWWQTESAHTCARPTTGGGASSSVSGSPAIHLELKAKVADVVAGAPVLMEGQGLKPGSSYSLVVRSTPVTVKSGVASPSGTFSHTVGLPAGIAPGVHTITLTGTGPGGETLVLTQSFTVAPNGTFSAIGSVTGQVTGGLAATGVDGPLALGATSIAALLVLVGVALMVARRRAEALSS